MIFNYKKGFAAAGFGKLATIIVIIVVVGIIGFVLWQNANKVEAKSAVELCRISNEIVAGTEERTSWWNPLTSPRICSTISKMESKSMVPTKGYSSDKKGAMYEVGDMLANCWYMWLEGSTSAVYPKFLFFGGNGCHVCYTFKIKKDARGFKYEELLRSLKERAHSATDISDNCAGNGGFLEENENWRCGPPVESGWKISDVPIKGKCCIRKQLTDECGNKGGYCSSEGPIKEFQNEYGGWSCPKASEKCYVTEKNYNSYLTYLTNELRGGGGEKGQLLHPGLLEFDAEKIYAISFYSKWEKEVYLSVSSWNFAEKKGCKTS